MRDLDHTVAEYISKPTDYAIQIVGDWGIGKTFHFKNSIQSLISKSHVFADASKKYKPVYVSMFGLKTIDDLSTRIVLEFYQSPAFKKFFDSKALRITEGILKIGFQGYLNLKRMGNIEDYLAEVRKVGKKVLDTSELVVCFDDLERADAELNATNFIGYINHLVEEGTKVIILANEDKLQQVHAAYKDLKEKVIGITLPYIPDIQATLNSIIKTRYAGFRPYTEFLGEQNTLLLQCCSAVKDNFRHISYGLDILQTCFSAIKAGLIEPKNENGAFISAQLPNIALFTLAIAIEFKSSTLTFKDKENCRGKMSNLKELISSTRADDTSLDKGDGTEDLYKMIKQKYDITEYHFYDSIFDYATGMSEFDVNQFLVEFKEEFKLGAGSVLPHYIPMQKLSYEGCFDLNDTEYRTYTQEMLAYAARGLYSATDYLSVMHYCERLDNPLRLDLDAVEKTVKDGLDLSIKGNAVNNHLVFEQFKMSGTQPHMTERLISVYKDGLVLIEQEKMARTENANQNLLNAFTQAPANFLNEYFTDPRFKSKVLMSPFLYKIEPAQLKIVISVLPGSAIRPLIRFIRERYTSGIPELERELPILTEFASVASSYREELDQQHLQVKAFVIGELEEAIGRLLQQRQKGLV